MKLELGTQTLVMGMRMDFNTMRSRMRLTLGMSTNRGEGQKLSCQAEWKDQERIVREGAETSRNLCHESLRKKRFISRKRNSMCKMTLSG